MRRTAAHRCPGIPSPQLLDRTRHASVIAAISGGEGSGLLALMIHRAVASLTGKLLAAALRSVRCVDVTRC